VQRQLGGSTCKEAIGITQSWQQAYGHNKRGPTVSRKLCRSYDSGQPSEEVRAGTAIAAIAAAAAAASSSATAAAGAA